MYIVLKKGNFIVKQPNGTLFSYRFNDEYMRIGINESAFDIIKRLDGTKSEEQVVDDLCIKYNEKKHVVEEMTKAFIEVLKKENIVETLDKPCLRTTIRGSSEYYTPEHVTIELTHKCPLKCKHCFVNAGNGMTIDYEKSKKLLATFLNLGVNIFQLTGGEPFVFKQIKEHISAIIENGRAVHITTSGFIYSRDIEECLDTLVKSEQSKVQVSLDGLKNRHNEIRGHIKAYDRAIFFIEQCVSRNIATSVATSLIDQDIEEIEKLTVLVKNKGVREHRLGLVVNQGRAKKNNLTGYTYDEYKEVLKYLKSKYDSEFFTVKENEDADIEENCGAGYKTLKITPSLLVTPCAMMQFNIGNLNNENIEDVLKRNYKRFSLLEYPNPKYCNSCSEEVYCKGCISEAIVRKNNVKECSWEVSQKERLYI